MNAVKFGGSATNQHTILGHPVGLYVLFFTEMWERFSYYGMRAILVLYLISTIDEGGLGWDRSQALVLYATYTGLVYLTPLLGGYLADRFLGYRNAVVLGAFIMSLGHASLAFEVLPLFYLGIALLIIGNGFFKPNMTPIVGQMYPDGSPLKDSAYTIFYMGVNSGAFLGILLCGWLGETQGWAYGFGAAGVFMFFGLLQFYFGQSIFGNIGAKPEGKESAADIAKKYNETVVPFTTADVVLFVASLLVLAATVLGWVFIELEQPLYKLLFIAPFVLIMLTFLIVRLSKYPQVERDRMVVIGIFAFFVIFFWLAFEQAGGTMTIFAEDYTQRSLTTPVQANIFRYVSLALTFIPMLILSWMVFSLATKIVKDYPFTILFTSLSFLIIWGVIVKINMDNFSQQALEVPASWFGSLNAFFIISLAPFFSRMWEKLNQSSLNPSGPLKLALGLFLLGIGFVALVIGAAPIPKGAETAAVSMMWLVLAYFFHTVGELFLSPVGLSFVNKLSPKRLIALMFGVWYLANFVANFTGGMIGSYIDEISKSSSLSGFFSIFVVSSFTAALLLVLLNKPIKRMMHGVN